MKTPGFRLVFPIVVDGEVAPYMTEAMSWPEATCLRRHCPFPEQISLVADLRCHRRRQRTATPQSMPLKLACGAETTLHCWRLPVPYVARDPALDVHGKPRRRSTCGYGRAMLETIVSFLAVFGLMAVVDAIRRNSGP